MLRAGTGVRDDGLIALSLAQAVWHKNERFWNLAQEMIDRQGDKWLSLSRETMPGNIHEWRSYLRPVLSTLVTDPMWHSLLKGVYRNDEQSRIPFWDPPPVLDWSPSFEERQELAKWWQNNRYTLKPLTRQSVESWLQSDDFGRELFP